MASSRQLLFNPTQYFRPKPSSLKIRDEISRGAYGSVHSGELDGRPVAVKRIHRLLLEAARAQGDFEQVMTDFMRECQLLENLDHPHLVDFRGAFYDETTDEPVLVMERMRENPREFLEKNETDDLSRQRQLEICLVMALGLRYLHAHTPPIYSPQRLDRQECHVWQGWPGEDRRPWPVQVEGQQCGVLQHSSTRGHPFHASLSHAGTATLQRETGHLLSRCAHAGSGHSAASSCGTIWHWCYSRDPASWRRPI